MKNYPEPIVGALITNKKKEILLIKQSKWKNQFCIPGGHIELNESIEKALKREVKEEVGINVKIISLLGVQDSINSASFHKTKHFIFLDFLCETAEENIILDEKEAQGYIWTNPKKALEFNLSKGTRHCIKIFLKNYSFDTCCVTRDE